MKHYQELLTIVKKRKLQWYGHVTTVVLDKSQWPIEDHPPRYRSRWKKKGQVEKWTDNIAEWTGKNFATAQDRLAGLVVRRPPRERKVPGSNPACGGIFFGVESYQ